MKKVLKWEVEIDEDDNTEIYHWLVSVADDMVELGYVTELQENDDGYDKDKPFRWHVYESNTGPEDYILAIDNKSHKEIFDQIHKIKTSLSLLGNCSTFEEAKACLIEAAEKCGYEILSEDLEAYT
jgi:hypothetical protein